jgi:hypothetical protein
MLAAEHLVAALNTVTDDAAAAVAALGGKGMNGALERIERVARAVKRHGE